MWFLLIWAVSSANIYYPSQTLVAVSEQDCRQMEAAVNNMKLGHENIVMRTYKAECVKSKF